MGLTDKEQEWIQKFRVAIETASPPIKRSRLKAILADLRGVRRTVNQIMSRSGKQAKALLSKSVQLSRPDLASASVTSLKQRHGLPARSSHAITIEKPAYLVPRRRRAG